MFRFNGKARECYRELKMRKIIYKNKEDLEKNYIDCLNIDTETLNNQWNTIFSDKTNFLSRLLYNLNVRDIILADYKTLVYLSFFCDNKNLPSQINDLFNYNNYSDSIHNFFNKNIEAIGLNSCPYCDTSFNGFFKTKEKDRSLFELDHFFPKEQFPLFALSLYNFVPCCQFCNQRIKGRSTFSKFYNLDFNSPKEAVQKLLHSSPVSSKYNLEDSVYIRYIPNITTNKEIQGWHYSPLSQKNADLYKVFFDTDPTSQNATIIDSMKLEDRYNLLSIKMNGLYWLDLKKRYSKTYVKMFFDFFTKLAYTTSIEQIENDIFHKDNKYSLLQKLKNDLLE